MYATIGSIGTYTTLPIYICKQLCTYALILVRLLVRILQRIENLHRRNFPIEDRTRESLKRKFQELYRSKIPTGDPSMPNDVRRAKMIQRLMEERINSSDCEGIDDFASTFEEEEQPEFISESVSSEEWGYDSSANMSSQTDMSTKLAKRPAKITLSLASRKPNKPNAETDNNHDLSGIKEMMKIQMIQRQQEKEDDRRYQQQNEAMMNSLMMTVLMAAVPSAAPGIAAMIQETNNNNETRTEEVEVQAEDES